MLDCGCGIYFTVYGSLSFAILFVNKNVAHLHATYIVNSMLVFANKLHLFREKKTPGQMYEN